MNSIKSDIIEKLIYIVTNRCNAQCHTCNLWKKNHKEEIRPEISLGRVKTVFTNSRYLRSIKKVSFTGGEPFLRDDLLDIFDFFYHFYECTFSIPTNGILYDRIDAFLDNIMKRNRIPDLFMSVSIDTLHLNGNDRKKTKFTDSILKSIDIMKKYRIPAGVSFTISPYNYMYLKKAYEFAKHRKLIFTYRLAQIADYYNNTDIRFDWKPDQLNEVKEQIRYIIKDKYKYSSLDEINSNFDYRIYFASRIVTNVRNPERDFPCYSGRRSFVLSPYGDVYPCVMVFDSIGNIQQHEFDTVWESEKRAGMIKKISHFDCQCWTECEMLENLEKNIEKKQYLKRCAKELFDFIQ